ncbi:MAG: hypothetical protein RL394_885 [Bacteroidota bacterium]|jgi:UDP-N-acetylmuramyl pentapeptide phosphotransferase/UDP-N-acetylglucosamine-1-phosphate transferase
MGVVFFALLLSFSISFVTIPVVIKMVNTKQLHDLPGNRKIHRMPTPSMGGIAFFVSLMITLLLTVDFAVTPAMPLILAAMTIVFFVGLKDDIMFISPLKKFAGQIIAVFIIVYKGYYQLHSFEGFIGIGVLHPAISVLFTFFTMLVVINAFNLVDGVDGLAASLGLMSTLFFGVAFLLQRDMPHALMALTASAALIAFLLYNWHPASIFLGDTGSLLVGLVNAVLVTRFISGQHFVINGFSLPAAALGFSVLFIPLADTLRLVVTRIYQGNSPFEPDVYHLHHILLNKGLAQAQVTLAIFSCNCLFVLYAYFFQSLGNTWLILSMFAIAWVGFGLLQLLPDKEIDAGAIVVQDSEKSVSTSLLKTGNPEEFHHLN